MTEYEFAVDRNVKLWARVFTGGRYKSKFIGYRKYPWPLMKVGDSFFVPDADPDLATRRAMNSGRSFARAHPGKRRFTSRITPKGVRIWRIE